YAKRAERVGPNGRGPMMKMANQIAVAGSVLGLCESLAFAKKAGLELAQAKDLIGGGAAGSWAFDTYGPKILAGDWTPGFSIKNQRKDLAYCLKSALEVDAALPGAALVDRLLKTLEDRGDGEKATTALFQAYLEMGA
ncbi:MAG: NAD(P)-dependent oxidoreductase, partial [Fimbriimonas ginsengisoli]|nr:NAD(P)-dependent oxidoreductase [Fimbriimonas ginsengisoli]